MNDKQKKIIRNTLIVLLGLITTFGFVCFIITKIPSIQDIDFIKNYANYIQWMGLFFPTFLGVLFKFILGQYQAKVIKDTLDKSNISNENKEIVLSTIPYKKQSTKQTKNKPKSKKQDNEPADTPKSYGYC